MGEISHQKWIGQTEDESEKGKINWKQTDNHLILAVAKGLEGIEHFRGQVGAQRAVEITTEVIQKVAERKKELSITELSELKEELINKIVTCWKEEIKEHFHRHLFTEDDTAQLMLNKLAKEKGEQYSKQVKYSYFTAYRASLLTVWISQQFILYLRLGSGKVIFLGDNEEVNLPFAKADNKLALPATQFEFSYQDLTKVRPEMIFFSGVETEIPAAKAANFGCQVREKFGSQGLQYLEDNLDQILSMIFPSEEVTKIPRGVFCRAELVREELGANLVAAIKTGKSAQRIKELIGLGAPVDYTDLAGRSPLMLLLCNYNQSRSQQKRGLINLLLTRGADVNQTDNLGWTPLLLAARNCVDPEIIKELIKAGAEVEKRHTTGESALDYAGRNENLVSTEAYELLRRKTRE